MRVRPLPLTLALGCVVSAGCRNHPYRDPAPRVGPPGPVMSIPPAGIPEGTPPPPVAPIPRGAAPAPAPPPSGELLLPQNPNRAEYPRIVPPRRGTTLRDPDYVEKPRAVEGRARVEESDKGPSTSKRPQVAEDPPGLPDFTRVKDGVAAGRRPDLAGLDWLKTKGYRTVVYLRQPDEDDTTDRRQVEKRELKYVSLTVAPETLTQQWVDEFNKLVGETGSRPLYVYGDPAVTGPVWYLHLRTAEFLTHDEARVRAGRLGKLDESSDWFKAIQKIVPTNP